MHQASGGPKRPTESPGLQRSRSAALTYGSRDGGRAADFGIPKPRTAVTSAAAGEAACPKTQRRDRGKVGSPSPGPRMKSWGRRALGMVKVLPHVGPVNTQAPYIVPLCTSAGAPQASGFKGRSGRKSGRRRVEKIFCGAESVVFPLNIGPPKTPECGQESGSKMGKETRPGFARSSTVNTWLDGNGWELLRAL